MRNLVPVHELRGMEQVALVAWHGRRVKRLDVDGGNVLDIPTNYVSLFQAIDPFPFCNAPSQSIS